MTDNNDLVMEWYKFAMRDFDSAKYLCGMHPKPLEIICYHCQQSVEKFFKGFLVANKIEPPKIHDLVQLRIMCSEIKNDFEELKVVSQFLTSFGSQPRYPNEIEIFEPDMEKALQSVQDTIDFFEAKGIKLKPD
ncbi:MAG: HEPN domain-containing protein [Treponema sp.]|nr:HEPN domain-containing protein [Treponema sp.]